MIPVLMAVIRYGDPKAKSDTEGGFKPFFRCPIWEEQQTKKVMVTPHAVVINILFEIICTYVQVALFWFACTCLWSKNPCDNWKFECGSRAPIFHCNRHWDSMDSNRSVLYIYIYTLMAARGWYTVPVLGAGTIAAVASIGGQGRERERERLPLEHRVFQRGSDKRGRFPR